MANVEPNHVEPNQAASAQGAHSSPNMRRSRDPIGGPYIEMRSQMWPRGTSEYVVENSSPEWEKRLIEKLTAMYEEYLHNADEINRKKEQEYEREMDSDKGLLYKILLTHSYRSLTGGAVAYFFPGPNEPTLNGPIKVRKFQHELEQIARKRPAPKRFAVEEYPAIKTLTDDKRQSVGVASWIIDIFCYEVTGTFDKLMMMTSMQMELLSLPGTASAVVPKSLLSGVKISIGAPRVAKTAPQVRGQSRVPGNPNTRSATGKKQLGRRPIDDEVTEPVPPPESFPLDQNISAKRTMRELFLPAYSRGQKVLWRFLRARKLKGDAKVDEVMRCLIMLGKQSGLEVRVGRPTNVQGQDNVSFRTQPGKIFVDQKLLNQPDRLWAEAFHDATTIYFLRQATGHWPTAKNLHLVPQSMAGVTNANGKRVPYTYHQMFEYFVQTPVASLQVMGLKAIPH